MGPPSELVIAGSEARSGSSDEVKTEHKAPQAPRIRHQKIHPIPSCRLLDIETSWALFQYLAGVEDRTVACAAAQVAVEPGLQVIGRRLDAPFSRTKQRGMAGNYDAGGAEAALAAVELRDAL